MSKYSPDKLPVTTNDDSWWEKYGLSDDPPKTTLPLTYAPRCYESHKEFKLGNGTVFGGSCTDFQDDYDIYVGLDWQMAVEHRQAWPWEKSKSKPFVAVHFPITDYSVPKDTKNFKAMIAWLCNQLQEGKSVHIGCIGGHGRTGMVLSALVHAVTGNKNSTAWVRKHYCKKAVESGEQVNYLFKHFGITKVAPAKTYSTPGYTSTYSNSTQGSVVGSVSDAGNRVPPIRSKKSIWGDETV